MSNNKGIIITFLVPYRTQLLQTWNEKSEEATYGDLLKACVDIGSKGAQKIVDFLKGDDSSMLH